ncbi:hypothetical protein [Flavobacterium sp. 25HG05S-40]|uniref:hypothetical protein n=1 Tax=Flavobacterium sp. 25HG05S-40 TaxID=3458682 RepID=UPI004044B843
MKNNLRFLTLLFISAFSLSSCTSDDNQKDSDGITTGNYYPLAEQNDWRYVNPEGEESFVYAITTRVFDNTLYYRILDNSSEVDVNFWMAKKGASYYQKIDGALVPLSNGATLGIGEYEIKLFKDDLAVGDTWKGSTKLDVTVYAEGTPQKLPASLKYTGTILERDATVTLGTETYTNVIKMKLDAVEKVNSQTTNIVGEYWFAKDIGLVRESVTSSVDNVTKTRYLTSHELH